MGADTVTSCTITVEHVTIRSGRSFDAVRARLETLLLRLDDTILQLLRDGDGARALQRMEAGPPLSIFSVRDHGRLLAIVGLHSRALQYEIGNQLTTSKMTRHRISAAPYAPIRVLCFCARTALEKRLSSTTGRHPRSGNSLTRCRWRREIPHFITFGHGQTPSVV
jgi:hypothetical protein